MWDEMMSGGDTLHAQAQSPPSGPQRLTIAPKQPGWSVLADHHDVFLHPSSQISKGFRNTFHNQAVTKPGTACKMERGSCLVSHLTHSGYTIKDNLPGSLTKGDRMQSAPLLCITGRS